MPKVYIELTADFLHKGHINIISEARKYGDVIVGLLTDEAISYKRKSLIPFEQRKSIIENIKGILQVIPQNSFDCTENIKQLRPDFVVHGDDWKKGMLSKTREKVISLLNEWGGKLIEPTFTEGISTTQLIKNIRETGTSHNLRVRKLKELINSKPLVRILESHSGLTGLIIEKTKLEQNGEIKEFDGMWSSSLTDSALKGKPDTGAVDITSRVHSIQHMLEVTSKPIIMDADNGGLPEHFAFTVKTLERIGVSAVIIEDKTGPKRNSLFGTEVKQTQENIEEFSEKIKSGIAARTSPDFMVIARIESLILKKGLYDALIRAKAYIDAGADAIMIHSKEQDPAEIIEFCREYKNIPNKGPLVVVPTTYNTITEKELQEAGAQVIIYANHLLRSAYPAMVETARTILKNERAHEADQLCMPIKEILRLVPGGA